MNKDNHPFHMVTKSPWPILTSLNLMTLTLGTVTWINTKEINMIMMIGNIMSIFCSMMWWKNVLSESIFEGNHTNEVMKLIKGGMSMFILSEMMLFISLFWSFFHDSLSPNIELGAFWPPKSIITFNPAEIPMLNTIVLLSSASAVTWAHQLLLKNKMSSAISMTYLGVLLGIYFTILQAMEYLQSSFTFADSAFGSTFFLMTGFHGIHVLLGTMFILMSLIQMNMMYLSKNHHMGFEMAAWYWHFVDMVWLFLYILVYWWSDHFV